MIRLIEKLCALVFFMAVPLRAVPSDWAAGPITIVSEDVNVSVGPKMALIVGRYWFQYVAKFDDPISPRIAIYYPAFVPKEVTEFRDLLEVSQAKLMIGDRVFLPESARVLSDAEVGLLQVAPEDAAIAWFTFQIPRELAKLRFAALISNFQPHYHYRGKTIAAYWPWLPQLEALRAELELIDQSFTVVVEALPDVQVKLESENSKVVSRTLTRITLHPVHAENIAVSVGEGIAKAAKQVNGK